MARDFSVIVDPYLWKRVKKEEKDPKDTRMRTEESYTMRNFTVCTLT